MRKLPRVQFFFLALDIRYYLQPLAFVEIHLDLNFLFIKPS